MKFEEKIIKLRKQKNMSQEELAEKLNVTRQTISKWELGQSKPDMEKLIEISNLFEVGVETLTNESLDVESVKKVKSKKERKWLLYVMVVILVASSTTLAIRIGMNIDQKNKEKENFMNNIFGTITGIQGQIQNQINNDFSNDFENDKTEMEETISKSKFNLPFIYSSGTNLEVFVSNTLDDVITSNKTNKEMLITVVYGDIETTDTEKIKSIKKMLKEFTKYEVSVDYDDNGYVNKITIEDI